MLPKHLATQNLETENEEPTDSANDAASTLSSSSSDISDDWVLCEEDSWDLQPESFQAGGGAESPSHPIPDADDDDEDDDSEVDEDMPALESVGVNETTWDPKLVEAKDNLEFQLMNLKVVENAGQNFAQVNENPSGKPFCEFEQQMAVAQDEFNSAVAGKHSVVTRQVALTMSPEDVQKLNGGDRILQSQKAFGFIPFPIVGDPILHGGSLPKKTPSTLRKRKMFPKEAESPLPAFSLRKRLDLLMGTVGQEWVKPEAFPDTRALAELVIQALAVHQIGIYSFAKWGLGLFRNSLVTLLLKPKPWGKLKSGRRDHYRRMIAFFRDAESIRLLKSFTAQDKTAIDPHMPPTAQSECPPKTGDEHVIPFSSGDTDVGDGQRFKILEKNDEDSKTVQTLESCETGLDKNPKFKTPEIPLEKIEMVQETVKFCTLMVRFLANLNLQFLKMESVEIEMSNGVVITELELFDAIKSFDTLDLVAFSPVCLLLINRLFNLPQIELQIGQITSKSGRMLLFSSQKTCMVSSLPGIGRTLEMLSDGCLVLNSLSLRDMTLDDSEGIRRIFQNLVTLSLKDVIFRRENVSSPEMPPTLLQNLTRLVKFRVEETKGLHYPSIQSQRPTPHFPTTVKHLALLEYAPWYFRPPTRDVEFDYVQVTDKPIHGHVPVNTKYLFVPSLRLLNSALVADHVMKGGPLKEILVDRSKELKNGRHETGKVGVALLLNQIGIPITQEKFSLVRENFGMPWKEGKPSAVGKEILSAQFLNDFSQY